MKVVTLSFIDKYDVGNPEADPLGILFLELYLARHEQDLPEEEIDWIEQVLRESEFEAQRQRKRVHFLNDTTNEHCAYQLSAKWDAPDDIRIPEWLWDLSDV